MPFDALAIETQLLEAVKLEPEQTKEVVDAIIAELPEPNSQGEIKSVLEGLTVTVHVSEKSFVYLKKAD